MKKYKVTKSFTFDGKRYYVKADTEVEAEVKKALKLRDLEEGKVAVNGSMTVRQWSEQCVSTYKTGVKDITLKKYNYRMESCVLKHIGKMKLKDVKPLHCQECLNRQQGNSKYQIKQTRQMLNFLFSKAVQNKLILENPAADLSEPAGYENSRRNLTDQEEKVFLEACTKDSRFKLFLLMFYCGCRPSEAMSAQGKDIINDDGYILLHIRGTKTKSSDRQVPVPEELYEVIKNTPKFSYIATNKDGNKFDEQSYKRAWNSLKREMNILMGCEVVRNRVIPPYRVAPDLVPYCLRHTFCTNLQKQGVDLRTAQYLMGHSDIKMTANIYTHADRTTILEAAKLIGFNSGFNSERSEKVIK